MAEQTAPQLQPASYGQNPEQSYEERKEGASNSFILGIGILSVPIVLVLVALVIFLVFRFGATIEKWAGEFWDLISNFFTDTIGGAIVDAFNFVKDELSKVWDGFLKYVVKPIKSGAEDLVDDAVDLAGRAVDEAKDIWGSIKDVALDIKDRIVAAATKVLEAIEDVWNTIKPYVIDIYNAAVTAITGYFEFVFDFYKTIFEGIISIFQAIGSVISDIIGAFSTIVDFIENFFSNIGDAIGDALSSIGGDILDFF